MLLEHAHWTFGLWSLASRRSISSGVDPVVCVHSSYILASLTTSTDMYYSEAARWKDQYLWGIKVQFVNTQPKSLEHLIAIITFNGKNENVLNSDYSDSENVPTNINISCLSVRSCFSFECICIGTYMHRTIRISPTFPDRNGNSIINVHTVNISRNPVSPANTHLKQSDHPGLQWRQQFAIRNASALPVSRPSVWSIAIDPVAFGGFRTRGIACDIVGWLKTLHVHARFF